MIIANEAAGKNQPVDDTNHTDYPVIYADVVSGEQDVVVTIDENGNQIQNIYKVILTTPDGFRHTLQQVDITDADDSFMLNSTTGIPYTFDLSANGIFLHQTPNFSLVGALEIWTSRGGSYFTSADTTKKPGIPERFGEYLILRPSYFYCLEKGKEQASAYREALYGRDGRGGMEAQIKAFYAKRNKVDEMVITSETVNSI